MSQTVDTLLKLRELILNGELAPGQRVSELTMVDRLGVSRTPVRAALVRLESEGLLEPLAQGGHAVARFTEQDLRDAIEVRGVLEGLAANFAARRGAESQALDALRACVDAIDAALGADAPILERFSQYVALNERFHGYIVDLAGSPLLKRQLARASALPFASPSGFVMAQAATPEAMAVLATAQAQHRAVLEAIEDRDGGRAEAVMREHARLAHQNLRRALRNRAAMGQLRGAALIDFETT
ncbi:GntR family transcriptional regulator [Caulobacter sp. S45]|uniref:GntR family transcriptional regulator n=1 Tax=Caulobacter sp. S45 TaxID=1641861 RepID=UPI00131DAECA|nr:GntR family transcriptional regulator [Caulobacter sp. S45]